MTVLAAMLAEGRDELLCDMAETYHVLDPWRLPAVTLAALACGLREDSRVKTKLGGMEYVPPSFMLANIADLLISIRHGLFAKKGDPAPQFYGSAMIGKGGAEKQGKADGYASGEDFLRAMGQL